MKVTIMRWSGGGLMAGALTLGVAVLLASLRLLGGYPSPLVTLPLLLGALLLMLTLPGMYARQSQAAGWLGLGGHVLLEIGNVLLLVYAAAPLFTPASQPPGESAAAFILGIVLLLGLVLTAIATLRAAVYPRGSGILLLVAGLGFLVSFFVAEDLPPIAGFVISSVFGMLLAAPLAWIGGSIWRGAGQPAK